MLRIKITKESNFIEDITFIGHAMYNDYGKDIVCAAASATFICTVNAILRINDKAIEVIQDNDFNQIKVKSCDDIVNKLINNMVECLKSLEKQYPKNIQIK